MGKDDSESVHQDSESVLAQERQHTSQLMLLTRRRVTMRLGERARIDPRVDIEVSRQKTPFHEETLEIVERGDRRIVKIGT